MFRSDKVGNLISDDNPTGLVLKKKKLIDRNMIFISDLVQCLDQRYEVLGSKDACISNIKSYKSAKKTSLTWFSRKVKTFLESVKSTDAKVIVCDFEKVKLIDKTEFNDITFIACEDPKSAVAKIGNTFFVRKINGGIDPTARIEPSAKIAPNVFVGAGCYIGNDVIIENGSIIHAGCIIGDNSIIGENVKLQPGVIIGYDGYGHIKKSDGSYEPFPHLGKVVIENNVDVGANSCIDKGGFSDTVIGVGSKIDNLCHIAHNVTIGKNCILTANTTLAGSVTVGDNVWFSPSSTILNKVTLGDNCFVGIGSVVVRNVPPNKKVFGNPAKVIGPNN